jgi:hypothetical protein
VENEMSLMSDFFEGMGYKEKKVEDMTTKELMSERFVFNGPEREAQIVIELTKRGEIKYEEIDDEY